MLICLLYYKKMAYLSRIWHVVYNNCMYRKLNIRDIVKILLTKEGYKQKELVQLMTEKTGKKHTPDGLSRKLVRETITYKEVDLIADVLDYDIEFVKRK